MMPHSADNSPTQPHAGLEPEIELEPTVIGDIDDTDPSEYSESGTDSLEGWSRAPSNSSEMTNLLRSRLRSATGFVAIAYLVFLVYALVNLESAYGLMIFSVVLRGLSAGGIFGLLASRLELSFRQLRVLEYFFVIVEMAMFLWVQFSVNTHLIEQGDLMSVVALEKNGVMRTLIIMFTYAVFIPNTPRVTARVVLTMAACPIIILAIVLQYQPAGVNEMASTQNLGSNTIFVLIGAALSIFAAQTLNGLRYELSTARQLGQYRLLEKLGEGGMGAVYLAEHHLLKRPCALKLISPDLEDNSIAIARFEREVQSAAMLSHPNTIEIYDYGRADDGTFYYVMEYLPGLSVSDLVRQAGPLSPGRAIYLMRQVCGSLGEAHRMGLVHRDLKPANILVAILGGQCDVAKVLDFGLVKQTDPEAQGGPQLTADFTVSGTPSFMSPEQARGDRDVDGRADLYALGSILYFMLTGKPPFERENPLSLMIAHASEPVVPPTKLRPDVPADLEAVTLKCLAKSPADRYADARELSQALAACQNARDWDQTQAEQWWLEHAARQQPQAIETTSQHS